MTPWTERLRPRSVEGDVYRDGWIEVFELIFDGAAALIAVMAAVTFIGDGQWLAAAGCVALSAAMVVAARFSFFRPHLVVGAEVLVLSGRTRTRRIPLVDVRKAVASKGMLKLILSDGEEVYVPGHFEWSHARGDCYAYLAQEINFRIATLAPATGAVVTSPMPVSMASADDRRDAGRSTDTWRPRRRDLTLRYLSAAAAIVAGVAFILAGSLIIGIIGGALIAWTAVFLLRQRKSDSQD